MVALALAALAAGCAKQEAEDLGTAAHGVYAPTQQTQGFQTFACEGGDPVVVTGTDGLVLQAGAKITGPGVRDIVLENGIVKVTYELMEQYGADPPKNELGAHMLYRRAGATPAPYVRAFSSTYGDWTYFVSPFQQSATEAHVLTSNGDVAEVSFVFEHALDYPGPHNSYGFTPGHWTEPEPCTPDNGCGCFLDGCGVLDRDHTGNAIRISPVCDDASCLKRIHSVTLVKTIRVERCAEGYFAGLHSDPNINPRDGLIGNNNNAQGEREMGTGGWNAVTWSSAGNVFKTPGQPTHGWLGIDDPTYMGIPPAQYPSFPAEQAEGPWWVADLPYFNHEDEIPFVRYIVLEHRLEAGVYSWTSGHLGSSVIHYVNEEVEADGLPGRYQLFIGAMPYVSEDEEPCTFPDLAGTYRCFPNEPKPQVTSAVIDRVPNTWPR
ncbi:MAG: hypothetical protein R3F14_38070 [Polyangiaceae bacterium]